MTWIHLQPCSILYFTYSTTQDSNDRQLKVQRYLVTVSWLNRVNGQVWAPTPGGRSPIIEVQKRSSRWLIRWSKKSQILLRTIERNFWIEFREALKKRERERESERERERVKTPTQKAYFVNRPINAQLFLWKTSAVYFYQCLVAAHS